MFEGELVEGEGWDLKARNFHDFGPALDLSFKREGMTLMFTCMFSENKPTYLKINVVALGKTNEFIQLKIKPTGESLGLTQEQAQGLASRALQKN